MRVFDIQSFENTILLSPYPDSTMVVLELPSAILDFNEAVTMGEIPESRHVLSELVLDCASTRSS